MEAGDKSIGSTDDVGGMLDGNTPDVDNPRKRLKGEGDRITLNESLCETVDRSLFGFTFSSDNAVVSIFWKEAEKMQ